MLGEQVKRSIADNITEEVLLDEISQIIKLPMYADRMAKVQPQHAHMEKRRRMFKHKQDLRGAVSVASPSDKI
ncbi:hypothetical protein QJS04_geneDACA019108 [Acorus gramineus]|uniref:Uncharacterized protein n=1 Tax=Acorus gramineus TaxID=55184 RepID=A0AAV9A8G0_ACOGR|nr:hypothetical protein QJS04_geneDACA019108 [Acorus gramineus]